MTKRFGKFAMVGLVGIALQLLLLTVLTTQFRLSTTLSTVLAVEITVLHNFLWHQRFTWKDRPQGNFLSLLRFHLGNGLVSLIGNTILNSILVDHLQMASWVAGVLSIAGCSLANFAIADSWAFAPRVTSEIDEPANCSRHQ